MSLDPLIRYTAIINRTGEKIAGGYKEDITTLLNEDEQKMELYHAGQRWISRNNLIPKIGKVKYSLTQYEKLKRFTFPLNENYLLLVSTEITSDDHKIIKDILNLIFNINNA